MYNKSNLHVLMRFIYFLILCFCLFFFNPPKPTFLLWKNQIGKNSQLDKFIVEHIWPPAVLEEEESSQRDLPPHWHEPVRDSSPLIDRLWWTPWEGLTAQKRRLDNSWIVRAGAEGTLQCSKSNKHSPRCVCNSTPARRPNEKDIWRKGNWAFQFTSKVPLLLELR